MFATLSKIQGTYKLHLFSIINSIPVINSVCDKYTEIMDKFYKLKSKSQQITFVFFHLMMCTVYQLIQHNELTYTTYTLFIYC